MLEIILLKLEVAAGIYFFNSFFSSDLLEDDGNSPPKKPDLVWDKDVIYLPFTSSSGESGARGMMHTNKSLMAWFYSPDGAVNHFLDQMCGDSIACGNWFFHMSG